MAIEKIAAFLNAMAKAALDGKLNCPEFIDISKLQETIMLKENPSIKGDTLWNTIRNLEAYEQVLRNRQNVCQALI